MVRPRFSHKKDYPPVRYVYGITSALLLSGTALALVSPSTVGAQVAQNEDAQLQRVVPRPGAPASFADLTEQLQPAVVNISTRQRVQVQSNPFAGTPFEQFFGGQGGGNGAQPQTREGQSLGSGFIISPDGYVVTNNHVVAPAADGAVVEEITVTMPDRKEYKARVVGRDAQSDLAVLKIDGSNLPFVKFGDSTKSRVGDWVITIGNPLGFGGTVTTGIVSALYRNVGEGGPGTGGAYARYIQTDAAINRGNSGGPMFDLNGNVIGINSAIISPTGANIGLGFAIPADVAAPIVAKLRSGEAIERGYLGVALAPLDADTAAALGLAHNRGEFIQRVVEGEAGAKAGIKAGDVVVAVNGQEVTPDNNVSFLVANVSPGRRIAVDIIREGKKQQLNVVVGKRPPDDQLQQRSFDPDEEQAYPDKPSDNANGPDQAIRQSLGLIVEPLTTDIARAIGIDPSIKGLVIGRVSGAADAAQKGLRRGDVIVSANRQPVPSIKALSDAVAAAKVDGRSAILLQVTRRGVEPTFIAVRLNN